MYCLKCKRKTHTHCQGSRVARNNKILAFGECAVCGVKKSQFVKQKQSNKSGDGLINDFINKLPFEAHMPGHNFLGPGTKLNKRLNSDHTPKSWSRPVDRDDEAAYRHDLCYSKYKDTKTRNEVCDRQMLQDLEDILNPTASERRHTAVAKAVIGTKAKFGLGLKKKLPPPFVGQMH